MKILVTGGAGFIGSHVVDAYIYSGHEVCVVDDLSTGKLANLNPKAKFYHLDICTPELQAVFDHERPQLVNHHAAQASVPLSISDPELDTRTNVLGFINILQNCIRTHVGKVIFVSSGGAVYGEPESIPISENTRPQPLSIYAINKLSGEHLLRFYQHQYALDYTILRYANVYGPRQVSQGEAGVVSFFIQQLGKGIQPCVFRYPEEPEGMLRDYVYVTDVVQANLAALDKASGESVNIGTGIGTTTLDLLKEITTQMGTGAAPTFGAPRQGDIRRSVLDNSFARQVLGWTPRYLLAEGLQETVAYFQQINQ